MQTVKEFGGATPQLSLHQFWKVAGPVVAGIYVLVLIQVYLASINPEDLIGRLTALNQWIFDTMLMEMPKPDVKRPWSRGERASDLETPNPEEQAPTRPSSQEQALASLPPSHPREGTERSSIWV